MQPTLEDLQASLAQLPEAVRPVPKEPAPPPVRRALPERLPREEIIHEAPCSCPAGGGMLRVLGEDVSEMLEYVPQRYRVIRHVLEALLQPVPADRAGACVQSARSPAGSLARDCSLMCSCPSIAIIVRHEHIDWEGDVELCKR